MDDGFADERWLPLPGREEHYEVSDMGRHRKKDGRLLKPIRMANDYCRIRVNFPRWILCAHRTVALAFVPNPDGKPHVNHINSNRSDNRAANLQWCTPQENTRHMMAAGRANFYLATKRKLSAADMHAIRRSVVLGVSYKELSARYDVSRATICRTVLRAHVPADPQGAASWS